jgi:hypothetical protein
MTDVIRARLCDLEIEDRADLVISALHAVLDLCASVADASKDPALGPVCIPRVDTSLVEKAIAEAIGVSDGI